MDGMYNSFISGMDMSAGTDSSLQITPEQPAPAVQGMPQAKGFSPQVEPRQAVPEGVRHYELRKLQADDIFPMARILGKIGIGEITQYLNQGEFQKMVKNFLKERKDEDGRDVEISNQEFIVGIAVVTKIANIILLHMEDIRTDLYRLLSGLSGLKTEEIREMEIGEFLTMISDVIKKEEFRNFYRVASRFMK